MIGDVALEVAEHLEDSAVRFSFCATPINVEDWTDDVTKRITSLVEDILYQERAKIVPDLSTTDVVRELEKKLNTAKEFAHLHLGLDAPAQYTRNYADYVLDTLISVLLHKQRPDVRAYITRRPQ